jgi:transposase InsO family protein
MGCNAEDWAVFWCALLSPLQLGEIPTRHREAFFRELSRQERLLPNGQRKCISVRTLRRQWKRLRDGGVQGVYRRRRRDRGRPRKKQADLLARAVVLKKEQPYRSDEVINRILRHEFGRELPRSTLYRHLRREGATRRKLGITSEPIRCRWTREQSNALWVGDFEHGPPIMQHGQAIKTHLSAWIDCHSRYIVGARYYVRENLDILIDSLLRAWGHHGASRELYVDNAKIYYAKGLVLACSQLNIKLLHRPPLDPPAGGLIERFFETAQGQFEAEVRAAAPLILDDLNRLFQAWLDMAYHLRVHSQTAETPNQRYHADSKFIRNVDLNAVLQFFHQQYPRTVNADFCDVRIDSQFYAVDAKYRGDRLIVHLDPFSPCDEAQLYSPTGSYLGIARRYQREKDAHRQPNSKKNQAPIQPHYLDALKADHHAAQQRQRRGGIDYHSARLRNSWSFSGFAGKFAQLMGRTAGISALSAQELEILGAFHSRHDRVTETLLRQAFARTESPSIPHVLLQLQALIAERND